MPDPGISESLEDYLEVISELIENEGHAHVKAIAEKMNVKMPSVTYALRQLAARGLIGYDPHLPVVLTASGAAKAAGVRERHRLLARFFQSILKVAPAVAGECACKIEHVIDEEVMLRLADLCKAIELRPDCAGLREYLDAAMKEIHADPENRLISLDRLAPGQRALVARVGEKVPGFRKLAVMGIIKNAEIEMEGRAPFGDLLRVRVLGSSLTLRAGEAEQILVRPLGGDHGR